MPITLDRFMQMEYPVYSDPSDPRGANGADIGDQGPD